MGRGGVLNSLNNQGTGKKGAGMAALRWEDAGKFNRQIPPFFLSKPEHHGLGAFVDRWPGVVEGILGDIGKDKQIAIPLDPFQDVLP